MPLLIAIALGTLAAQVAKGQPDVMDMSLEDLMKVHIDTVYGASGYKQKVTEAPATITIITADEIKRYGYRTLADVLRNVPGFYLTNDRNYTYLGIRGFARAGDYNSGLLLLVDGHRNNDNIFDQALIGTEFPVDIDLIDRVEVIRGPNSSLYVASAFLAVINVITKPAGKQEGVTLSGEAGSYNTYKSRISYGHQFRSGLEMVASGTYYDSGGVPRLYFPEFDNPATNNGVARNLDADGSRQLFGSLSYRGFRLEGAHGSRDKRIPTAPFGSVFNDPRTHTVDARGYLDLAYDHNFGSNWGYTARVYYDRSQYSGLYANDAELEEPAIVLNRDLADGQWWGAKFALSKRLFENQTLVVGSEYEDNFQQRQTTYDEQPYFLYFTSRPTTHRSAVYAQDEIRLRSNVTLALGLRHDQYSTFGGTTNPRAALIYQPLERTTVKLLYGQAFRPPNAYELYYEGYGQKGNLHLQPERIKTMEVALEQYFRGGFRMSARGYYYPIRSLLGQETDPTGDIVYQNSQQVNLRGIEVVLKKESRSGVEAGVGFSFQRANQAGSQTALTNSPQVLGQSKLSIPFFQRKLFASAAVDYISRRATTSGEYAGAYFLPDFTLLSRSFRGWEISASLYNAFNQAYADPASIGDSQNVIIQNGRTFRLKLTFHP